MSKRSGNNIITEYHFLKRRTSKLYAKAKAANGALKRKEIINKIVKFHNRMKEIERECEELGIPHPEANTNPEQRKNDYLKLQTMSKSKALFSPDGTLFKVSDVKDSALIKTIETE